MASEASSSSSPSTAPAYAAAANIPPLAQQKKYQEDKRQRSIFEVSADFFASCRLLRSPSSSVIPIQTLSVNSPDDGIPDDESKNEGGTSGVHHSDNSTTAMRRWACSTCEAEFESLQEQRSHFSSDFHRLNIKLTVVGKRTVKEEDFDETKLDTLCKDFDVSSISGSEDEDERETGSHYNLHGRSGGNLKNKLFIQLQNGERVSVWKCLLLNEFETIAFENDKSVASDNDECYLKEKELTERLKNVIDEPRNATCLRVVLLAKGGHFAGCVFDGNSVIAHKTFHRYVVRAKAGKRQSSKDGSGKTIHSAGASLRRYNELALKKDIHELLTAWKHYFAVCSCVFLYAPSHNHQLFVDGKMPYFNCRHGVIQNIPLIVGRPTFKEARRIYKLLTQIYSEIDEEIVLSTETNIDEQSFQHDSLEDGRELGYNVVGGGENLEDKTTTDSCNLDDKLKKMQVLSDTESESENICASTPLHEAAKSGNPQEVFNLLEQGLDPCIKDERGRTPYMLATEKEVRNTFRRFMALNLDKWDWQMAKVPSALTKEMEESQSVKQAEKDAKRKARAKELKKLRKAREKKALAQAAESQNASSSQNYGSTPVSSMQGQLPSTSVPKLSKEEELKRAQDAEREKRAAAAERRIAAMAAIKTQGAASVTASTRPKVTGTSDTICSCCHVSLAGIVPFHRYNYKYCSASCMHLHKEILEDG